MHRISTSQLYKKLPPILWNKKHVFKNRKQVMNLFLRFWVPVLNFILKVAHYTYKSAFKSAENYLIIIDSMVHKKIKSQ